MFPVALHSDKRTHADHSGPKSPAWLKIHLKIPRRICRNVLENQPACWDSGFYFSLLLPPEEKAQQRIDQMGGMALLSFFLSFRKVSWNEDSAHLTSLLLMLWLRWFALPSDWGLQLLQMLFWVLPRGAGAFLVTFWSSVGSWEVQHRPQFSQMWITVLTGVPWSR